MHPLTVVILKLLQYCLRVSLSSVRVFILLSHVLEILYGNHWLIVCWTSPDNSSCLIRSYLRLFNDALPKSHRSCFLWGPSLADLCENMTSDMHLQQNLERWFLQRWRELHTVQKHMELLWKREVHLISYIFTTVECHAICKWRIIVYSGLWCISNSVICHSWWGQPDSNWVRSEERRVG